MKIAIASGKGGTGKTTLAVNLAAFISETDQVVLADLDVEEPDTALFLRGDTKERKPVFTHVPQWDRKRCTFCGLCQKTCNFHAVLAMESEVMLFAELCHGCFACSELCPAGALPMRPYRIGEIHHINAGLFPLIEGRVDIGWEQAVAVINKTLKYLDEYFAKPDTTMIFDSPPGTACPVVAATRCADYVILVTEPTPFGLHDLTLAVDVMRNLDKDIGVVVNRYGIGNDDVLAFCDDAKIPVIAKIPNDRKIAERYSRGELILTEIPEIRGELTKIRTAIHEQTMRAVI